MKRLSLLLMLPLLFAMPAFSQNSQKQEELCSLMWQGRLEESDPRLTESNAPYNLLPFRALQGTEIVVNVDSRGFAPLITLYRVVDGDYEYLESQDLNYPDRAWMSAWIYDDSQYAVRISPDMARFNYGEPDYTDAERPARGNYTIRLSHILCDQ